MISSLQEIIGNSAEFQVCHDLSKRGLRVARTPFDKSPYDVICEYHNKFLRVQVKGTSRVVIKNTPPCEYYQFNISTIKREAFDILALVSTDLETIHYLSIKELAKHKSTIMVPIKQMRRNKDLSLLSVLEEIKLSQNLHMVL